jgi:protein CrcB
MTPTNNVVRSIHVVKLFLAGVGGFVGSVLRYALSGFVQELSRSTHFPYGTLAVNLLGCLAIGLLSYLAETRGVFTAERAYWFSSACSAASPHSLRSGTKR